LSTPAKRSRWKAATPNAAEQREAKRRMLLIEAGRAFGKKGFHNTTLDEVAAALNVTKPALYRYVSNKHELLYECHRFAVEAAENAFEFAAAHATRPSDVLRRFVRRYLEYVTGEMGSWAILTERYSMLPEHDALIQARRRELDHRLRHWVQKGMDEGEFATRDAKLAVFFFMGAINTMTAWFRDGGPEANAHVVEVYTDLAMAALVQGARTI
jgi:TetR/AcrR family transcriptional regulator